MVKVPVFDAKGARKGDVELPKVFETPVRPDVIAKAFKALRANARQPYGTSPMAGAMHSTKGAGKGRGMARVPRIQGSGAGALAPPVVGGRRAHPPEVRRVWSEKINGQERKLALRSALAATGSADLVAKRGHRFDAAKASLPIVLDDAAEKVTKTQDVQELLAKIGVGADLERAVDGRHQRAGRGKWRGRRMRTPRSVLLVVRDPKGLRLGAQNLVGVDVTTPQQLNLDVLAPGGTAGRLTVFTAGALKALEGF